MTLTDRAVEARDEYQSNLRAEVAEKFENMTGEHIDRDTIQVGGASNYEGRAAFDHEGMAFYYSGTTDGFFVALEEGAEKGERFDSLAELGDIIVSRRGL